MHNPLAPHPNGCTLAIKLVPGSKKACIGPIINDMHGNALLKLHIAARPIEGQANNALCKFIAKSLALPLANVTIIKGELNREKVILLHKPLAEVAAWLDKEI